MQVCPNCAAESPDRFRLCGFCGTELRPDLEHELRRTVTVLFSDLKGSTSMGEALDSEALFEVLSRYFDAMRGPLERHGGKIEKLIGDAILAVFGLPIVHEDDPLRAVRAAAECQAALADLNRDLRQAYGVQLTNRTGLATGEATVGLARAGEHVLTGAVVQLAMELEAAAPPMGVLLAESTHRALGGRAAVQPVPLPAAADPAAGECAYELIRLTAAAETPARTAEAPRPEAAFCPNCGEENPAAFRVCGTCGASLAPGEGPEESRKTVTIVFCDLKAADPTGRPLPADALRRVVTRGFEVARGVVEHHGGSAEKFIGDAVVAVFGMPVLHEDDALRAVRTATSLQAALGALAAELRDEEVHLAARIGVNTGLVVAGDATPGLHLVTGDAVNTAARLEQAAPEDGILVGQSTYHLVRDAVDVEEVAPLVLKGKAEPVVAYRLVAVRGLEGRSRRHHAPMVGRAAELDRLRASFHESVVQNGPRLVTVLGEAGLGKSRLVREFEGYLGEMARVLRGRCLAYGQGITFWPISEIVRSAAGIAETDGPRVARRKVAALVGDREVADRLAAIAGLSAQPYPMAELFWAVRRAFEILARRQPLVVVIDGIQWAEPALVDLVEHVVTTSSEAPIQLVCLARLELLDARPEWAPGLRSTRLPLGPLSAEEADEVLANLLGAGTGADLADLRRRVGAAAQGNPLFMEQMVSMLVDNGALRLDDGRLVRGDETAEIALPPTIQALLAARVDQLPRDERSVVEPAAVVGYEFSEPAVDALVAEPVRPKVEPALGSLVGRQFVRPDPDAAGGLAGESAYRFVNLLVRDAAYEGLLKRSRVAFHERYVTWADRVNRERGRELEFEEILGYHLEQAYRYRTEFGPADAEAVAVGRDGARRLASAGRRAFGRGDMSAATNLLRRAAALLPEHDHDRLALLPELGEALLELGDFAQADAVLSAAIVAAEATQDEGTKAHAGLVQSLLRYYRGGDVDGWSSGALALAEVAIRTFERLDDSAGLTRAWRLVYGVHATALRFGAAARAAERVVEYARQAGDARQESRGGTGYAQAALLGPVAVHEAIRRCAEILARVQGDRRSEALVLLAIAELEGMDGAFVSAREHYTRARTMLLDLGKSAYAVSTSMRTSRVERLAGEVATAEQQLRRDFEALDAMGERYMLSTVAALLGQAVLAQGRIDEARGLAERARELTDADDVGSQALWRSLQARILALQGNAAEAVAMARTAVNAIRPADSPVLLGDALVDLGDVLAAARGPAAAQAPRREALALYETKGNRVAAQQVRLRLDEERQTSPSR